MLRGTCHKQAAGKMTDMTALMTAIAFVSVVLTLCPIVML